jgi:ammonium transporter, Amt family
MDIFSCHAVSGLVGVLMTGLFAQSRFSPFTFACYLLFPQVTKVDNFFGGLSTGSVTHNDAFTEIPGGWLDHHYIQLAKQLVWAVAGISWTFVITFIIMVRAFLLPCAPFLVLLLPLRSIMSKG